MAVKRYNISKEFLEREYGEKKRSLRDIAADFGCDKVTVGNKLRKFGVPVRKRSDWAPVFNSMSKEFLEREYVENKKSSTQIADELGCCSQAIIDALRKHCIEVRGRVDASCEFLRREYEENGKTTTQIANEIGCHRTTIIEKLGRFGIQARRGGTPSNHVNISEGLLEVLDGSLLGDGFLGSQSELSAYYELGQRHRSYVDFMAKQFGGFGVTHGPIHEYDRDLPSGNKKHVAMYRTHDYIELREQWNRWYPSGKKIVPADVRLTPKAMRAWFLEDGSFYTKGSCTLGVVRLHTNWFTENEVRMLIDRLKTILNTPRINFRWSKGKYPEIQFGHKDAVQKFFDYMGPFPQELCGDYGYKMLVN